MNPDPGGFHRIVGHDGIGVGHLIGFRPGLIRGDKLGVGRVIHGLKVVPGREVAHQRFGVDTAQFLFSHGEGHHRHVGGFHRLVRQLFIERYVRIAVDGGDHRRFATRREFLDVGDDGLVVAVTKRGIDLFDILIRDAFRVQERTQDLVGGARIDVVGP